MKRTTPRIAGVAVVACALVLSACGGSGKTNGAGASTSPTGSTSAGSGAASSAGSSAPAGPAGPHILTAADITAALPKVSDLPKGWTVDPNSTITSAMTSPDKSGVTPASCSTASQVQENFNFVAPSIAHGNVDFIGGQQGPFSGTTVYSFAAPYPASAFAAIRASVKQCPGYNETEDDGSKVPDHISLIPIPVVADGSLALEVRSIYKNVQLDLIIVLVRSGTTLIAVEDAAVKTPASLVRAAQLAQTTLTRVTAA